MHILGTTIVHTYIFKSELIYIGILKVYTKTNGFAMLFYVHAALEHVQAMYEPGTYIKCTNLSVYVLFHVCKKSATSGIEPRISRMESGHLNPFASSADAREHKVSVYIYTLPGGW
jgi:hypothetical protein